jgi:amino acid adenylation domain-containing protein
MQPLGAFDSLASAFAARERESPDRLALYDERERVTFAQLGARAASVAAGLTLRGLGAGAHVGVVLPRSIDAIACALGVFEAGGVLVPIDPSWPEARRAAVAQDADLACAIALDHGSVLGPTTRVVTIADLLATPSAARSRTSPHPVAVALYTSGSTGEPKAVLLPHRAILARLQALEIALPHQPDEVACHRTPLTFVDALAEVFGPLLCGVPVHVLRQPLSIADLVHALTHERISRLLLVPSLLAVLLDACPDLATLAPALRLVVSSGETLSSTLAKRLQASAPRVRLVNVYGSTEVAGDATLGEVPCPPPARLSIGRPLAGVLVHLIGEDGERVADGDVGEIVVGGPVVTLGYWKRPSLTRERFLPDASTPGAMLVRTGDLARRFADGSLELVGRTDDQVKVGGVRIELGEIVSALESHDAVWDAAVTTDASDGRVRVLAGVVVDAGDGSGTGDQAKREAIVRHLAARLPTAAMPSVLTFLGAIPRSAHGKVDRSALARLVLAPAGDAIPGETDAAEDPLATRIAGIFATLTGVARATTDAELGLLGGDSLTRLRLLVLLEREGFTLTHADLPAPLTPTTLAASVRRATPSAAPTAFVLGAADARVLDRERGARADAFPLTDFQRVMALESLANAGTSIWTDQVSLTLEGAFSVADFEWAWHHVVAREPSLRTSIAWRGLSEPLQVVHPAVSGAIAQIALGHLDLAAYRQRVLAEEWERMSTSFALDAAPLWSLCVIEGPSGRRDLLFTYHHVILDGESARRVLRAAFDAYAHRPVIDDASEPFRSFVDRVRARSGDALAEGFDLAGAPLGSAPEPPIALGMGDAVWRAFHHAVDLRQRVARLRVSARVRRHAGLGELLARERLEPKAYAGGDIVAQPLSRVLVRAVREWANRTGATATSVWIAIYALHLARETGRRDVVFGVIVAGRDGRTAGTVGMLANCLPLRIRVDDGEPIPAFVARVAAALRHLESYAQTPLLALARAVGLEPRVFLDTLFVTWSFADVGWEPPGGLRIRDGRGVTSTATSLAVILSGTPGAGDLAVASNGFHRAGRVRIHLLALLDALLDAPADAPVSSLVDLVVRDGGMAVALAPL